MADATIDSSQKRSHRPEACLTFTSSFILGPRGLIATYRLVCRLNALTSIDVHSSGFTGSIPLSAQGYPSLVSFVASGNDLTGTLPASIPANLTTLNVGDNMLNGTLPTYNSTTLGTFQVWFSHMLFVKSSPCYRGILTYAEGEFVCFLLVANHVRIDACGNLS